MKAQPTTSTAPILPKTGYIRAAKLAPFLAVSLSTLWRMAKNNTIPKPIKLTEKTTAWRCEDIHSWLDAKAAK